MGIYGRYFLPRMVDRVLGSPVFDPYRKDCVADLKGTGLEIGFGSGLNLPFYSDKVELLHIVEPNDFAISLAKPRMERVPFEIKNEPLLDDRIPVATGSMDFVVSTFTLCTIPNLPAALKEIARILKPGGKFRFLEHGAAQDQRTQRWQNLLNPVQKLLGGGCHLNRKIDEFVKSAGFRLERMEHDQVVDMKLSGYLYRGWATKGVAGKASDLGHLL